MDLRRTRGPGQGGPVLFLLAYKEIAAAGGTGLSEFCKPGTTYQKSEKSLIRNLTNETGAGYQKSDKLTFVRNLTRVNRIL